MQTRIEQLTGTGTQSGLRAKMRKALKVGLWSILDYSEPDELEDDSEEDEDEDEEPALKDQDEETANDDELFNPYDYEWSPWCDDTDSISLQEYLRANLNWKELSASEFLNANEILAKDEEQIRTTIAKQKGTFKKELNRLVEIYDFNYNRSDAFSDLNSPLPAVRISRTEKATEDDYEFSITVIDYYSEVVPNNASNRSMINEWKQLLGTFTQLLMESPQLKDFFSADSFEDGWSKAKKRMKKQRLTQISIARRWLEHALETTIEEGKEDKLLFRVSKSIRGFDTPLATQPRGFDKDRISEMFSENGFTLSDNVSVDKKAENKFLITDKTRNATYAVIEKDGEISFYELPKLKYYQDRVNEITNHIYVEIGFFEKNCLFKEFFPKAEDIR